MNREQVNEAVGLLEELDLFKGALRAGGYLRLAFAWNGEERRLRPENQAGLATIVQSEIDRIKARLKEIGYTEDEPKPEPEAAA